jgi:hypothetical protein
VRWNFSPKQIARARQDALDWLNGRTDGYPRSREQEEKLSAERGYEMHNPDDEYDEAPTITGYEALEAEEIVERVGVVMKDSQERVHFRLRQHPAKT